MSSSASADRPGDIQRLDAAICLLCGAAVNPQAALDATFHFLEVSKSNVRTGPAQTVLAVLGELVSEQALKQLADGTQLDEPMIERAMQLASQARREKGHWGAVPEEFAQALSEPVRRAMNRVTAMKRDHELWLAFEAALASGGPQVPNVQSIAGKEPGGGHVDLRSRRAATFHRDRAVDAADAICLHHRVFPYA